MVVRGSSFFKAITCVLILAFSSAQAANDLKVGSLIRDAEIEDYLHSYLAPLFKVAGLDISQLNLYIIHDPEFNAMASIGHTMIINTGLIMKCDNVNQLLGVMAHETGHIAGSHVAKIYGEMNKSQAVMLAGLLLGAAAGILAKSSEVATAVLLGGMQIGQANFLSFTRAHENAADQAAAKYLRKLDWSSQGMYEVMKKFQGQELLSSANQDPYMRTHPLTADRLSFFQHHAANNKASGCPADFERKFRRMRAKIVAYVNSPQRVLSAISANDNSVEAQYARSIAYFRLGDFDKSFDILNTLIAQHLKDPYFKELKAQMLFERGKISESIKLYQAAIQESQSPNMLTGYGLALVESNNSSHHELAVKILEKAHKHEPENPFICRLLAIANGKLNQTGKADLMIAKQEILLGNYDRARAMAKRAKGNLKNKTDIMAADEIIADDFAEEQEEGL